MKKPFLWEEMTVREIGEAIRRTRTVLLPLGVIEQHGFHLPTSVDTYTAYETCKGVACKIDCLVAPPYYYSYSGGELPGTVNINPHVVSLVLEEIVKSFIRQGLRNIIVVHGHGGIAINDALENFKNMFLRQNNHLKGIILAITGPAEYSPTWKAASQRGDWHAGIIETSLMLYWAPHLVREKKHRVLDKGKIVRIMRNDPNAYRLIQKPLNRDEVAPYIKQRPEVRVGVMGYLEGISAEVGKKVADECVAGVARLVRKIKQKASPSQNPFRAVN